MKKVVPTILLVRLIIKSNWGPVALCNVIYYFVEGMILLNASNDFNANSYFRFSPPLNHYLPNIYWAIDWFASSVHRKKRRQKCHRPPFFESAQRVISQITQMHQKAVDPFRTFLCCFTGKFQLIKKIISQFWNFTQYDLRNQHLTHPAQNAR